MIVARERRLTIVPPSRSASIRRATTSLKLVDVLRDHIRNVLEESRWRIRGVGGAAERLGVPPTTLETRMAKLGLVRPGVLGSLSEFTA